MELLKYHKLYKLGYEELHLLPCSALNKGCKYGIMSNKHALW